MSMYANPASKLLFAFAQLPLLYALAFVLLAKAYLTDIGPGCGRTLPSPSGLLWPDCDALAIG